jgi:hypothetical protein
MRKLTFGLLFALLAGFAVAQDPAKKDEPKKDETKKPEEKKPDAPAAVTSDYYPLAKGNKWTYLMGTTEVVVEVDSVTGGEAKLVTKHQGKAVANETVKVTADGVFRTKINDTPIDGGGVQILKLKNGAPTKGEKWPVAAKVQQSEVKGEFETKDVETAVKVPAGDFKAVYVEGPKFLIAGSEAAVKYWFVPKQGVVKLSYTIAGTESNPLELKSFEAGK